VTSPILLDASCVLAWLFDEPGAELIEPVLTTSYITAVNMAEVIRTVDRLTGRGSACAADLVGAGLTVVPFGWMHLGRIPGLQSRMNKKQQLSLGDSCCLAYGMSHNMDIWTADRGWAQLEANATITVIR
jgi:PIN domain nuclease of toxin-antitoxin system